VFGFAPTIKAFSQSLPRKKANPKINYIWEYYRFYLLLKSTYEK